MTNLERYEAPLPERVRADEIEVYVATVPALRERAREEHDAELLANVYAVLGACERKADPKVRKQVLAETRRTEVVIGEFLGDPADHQGRTGTLSQFLTKLHNEERVAFRFLAQHADLVEQGLAEGKVKRDPLIRWIEYRINPPPAPAVGEWGVILADPPWQYDFAETDSRDIDSAHYRTMSLNDLKVLPVPAAEDAVLFMWTTAPKARDAMALLDAWGFTYKSQAVWVKDKIGMGYWWRGRHELLYVATRGSFSPPPPSSRFDSVIEAPRTEHSRKPELVHALIDKMFPDQRKLEMFARRPAGDAWDVWGTDV